MPRDAIARIQTVCGQKDGELRSLIALVFNTGLRLAGAARVLVDDIKLDYPVPLVVFRERPWRRLKASAARGSSR